MGDKADGRLLLGKGHITIMKRLAFWIAVAALLVSAPRLAVTFVVADGIALGAQTAVWVFGGTGVASGIVLTGGNVYVAHALAQHWKRRNGLWAVLLVSWLLFLGFTVVLVAPLLVYGLSQSALSGVLSVTGQRWAWAITAALSVELLAAAAMAAHVLSAEPTGSARASGAQRDSASAQRDGSGAERTSAGRSVRSALAARAIRALESDVSAAGAPAEWKHQRDSAPTQHNPAPTQRDPAPTQRDPAPAQRNDSGAGVQHICACGRSFVSQQALAGHQRTCKQPAAQTVSVSDYIITNGRLQ